MSFFELFLLALGLSMDAFAVSVTNGMCMRGSAVKGTIHKGIRSTFLSSIDWKSVLAIALAFGFAQGVMPAIGYALGSTFADLVESVDHYIALILLGFIGGKMIYEAMAASKKKENDSCNTPYKLTAAALILQAIATSIDALVIGVSFAAIQVDIVPAVVSIAVITFVVCTIGCIVGKKFGTLFSSGAEIFGGAVLILLGVKIFLEHTLAL